MTDPITRAYSEHMEPDEHLEAQYEEQFMPDFDVEGWEDDTLPCGCSEGMCYCEPDFPDDHY